MTPSSGPRENQMPVELFFLCFPRSIVLSAAPPSLPSLGSVARLLSCMLMCAIPTRCHATKVLMLSTHHMLQYLAVLSGGQYLGSQIKARLKADGWSPEDAVAVHVVVPAVTAVVSIAVSVAVSVIISPPSSFTSSVIASVVTAVSPVGGIAVPAIPATVLLRLLLRLRGWRTVVGRWRSVGVAVAAAALAAASASCTITTWWWRWSALSLCFVGFGWNKSTEEEKCEEVR